MTNKMTSSSVVKFIFEQSNYSAREKLWKIISGVKWAVLQRDNEITKVNASEDLPHTDVSGLTYFANMHVLTPTKKNKKKNLKSNCKMK